MALGLGLTSFGGPLAHIGYFERAYVRERRWLSAEEFAGLVALCQMLPGPTSSQVGLLVGMRRAGWAGAFAAWAGFTLPSALLLFAFALLAPHTPGPALTAALHGLQLAAVAVVAQAVWSMARKLCPDSRRGGIALGAVILMLAVGGAGVQLPALLAGGLAGVLVFRAVPALPALPAMPLSPRSGAAALVLFLVLLLALPCAARLAPHSLVALAALFYQSGALVFGSGHVVLPLLRDALVPAGWLSDGTFLAGYGAAQAMPGPLFAVSAYLGAAAAPAYLAWLWAAVALGFMFLPGILLALAGLPIWTWLARHPEARAGLAGVNASVVGVLAAALCDPVWSSTVKSGQDVAVALAGFLLLERCLPPLLVVCACVGAASFRLWR